jgi:hypothetical protein
MYSLSPTFYPSNNCSRRCNLAFKFGSDAATGEVYCSLPGGPTGGHCVLYYRVLVCGAMTLTALVDDLNSTGEGYWWHPNVPPIELRVFPHLHLLGQDSPSLSVSGAEHPVLRHFGYIVLAFESTGRLANWNLPGTAGHVRSRVALLQSFFHTAQMSQSPAPVTTQDHALVQILFIVS